MKSTFLNLLYPLSLLAAWTVLPDNAEAQIPPPSIVLQKPNPNGLKKTPPMMDKGDISTPIPIGNPFAIDMTGVTPSNIKGMTITFNAKDDDRSLATTLDFRLSDSATDANSINSFPNMIFSFATEDWVQQSASATFTDDTLATLLAAPPDPITQQIMVYGYLLNGNGQNTTEFNDVWSLQNGSNFATLTFNTGAPAATPEPGATASILCLCIGLLSITRRRRRR